MTTIDRNSKKYRVLGSRPVRHDGADKVTGKAKYTSDIRLTGMLIGRILRSPHAHARIVKIDSSQAQAMDGVHAVITGNDFPHIETNWTDLGEGVVNMAHLSGNVMARDKVLYKGHAVAAVAARDDATAQAALAKIQVEYEVLPNVTWILDAMQDDAPLLHDDLYTESMGKLAETPSNVAKHLHFEIGNIEEGFEQADVVIEREFRTEMVHQGYIEPHVSVGDWNEDGRVKVWTATQGSFACRQQLAEVLKIPISQITVVPCEIGGGFGGKIALYLEPVAAWLSKIAGRPVKMTMQRDEVFEGTGPTPGSFVRVKLGATSDGKIVAADSWIAFDGGAYPGGPLAPGCMCVFSCYDIPNARVEGYEVVLNKPKTQAYRAPGATQVAFACESVVDELAARLKRDPIDLRLQNAAKEGTRRVDGPIYPPVGLIETLQAAQESEHWKTPLEGENRGRGIASGFWFGAGLKSSVTASVNPDGTINLVEGSTDIGGTRTSISMQLAEALGINVDQVIPQVVDTDSVGFTDVTGGSRVTFATGLAAYHAAKDIEDQLRTRAAAQWECAVDEIKVENGIYSDGKHEADFKSLVAQVGEIGEPLIAKASVAPDGGTNGFGTHIVDVEVDPETGKVEILRYTAIQDVGKAVHPSYVEGQLQGGAVQGIGWALNEEYFYDDGEMKNASFLDYRMPTCYDVPMIDTILVEVANPDHPYGVRGVGETPIVPPPPAIANAIFAAVGVRMFELPMSPPRLWKAISEK